MRGCLIWGVMCFPLLACQFPQIPLEEESQSIVGGQVVFPDRFRAVGALARERQEGGFFAFCTGTLIAPDFVLTAAHCVQGGNPERIFFLIGSRSDLFEEAIPAKRLTLSARFERDALGRGNDIALVELSEPVSIVEPLPIHREHIGEELLGKVFTAVGFGITEPGRGDGGIKRAVELTLDGFDDQLIFYGSKTANICSGDSGGPDLMDFDGELRVIGVHSFGTSNQAAPFCHNTSASQRVDVQAERFLDPVMEAAPEGGLGCVKDDFCEAPCKTRRHDPDCEIRFRGTSCAVGPRLGGESATLLLISGLFLLLWIGRRRVTRQ